MEEEANIISRIFGGSIVLMVGFAPSYICGILLFWLISGKKTISIGILVAILVSAIIAVPFYVLAYRILTGKGRKKDKGLISPHLLLFISILIVLLGISIGIFSPNENIIKSITGGGIFVLLGAGGVSLSIKRIKENA